MGEHPCRGRGNREEQPITGHITITNHSYRHGCASLQRERQQRGTANHRTHNNNQSQLPPWVHAHPCRGRGKREEQPITGHITITNHSYHHGWASLQRERQQRGTANHRTHYNNQSQLPLWVRTPQRERQQRGTENHRTHYNNNQSQLPPWVSPITGQDRTHYNITFGAIS